MMPNRLGTFPAAVLETRFGLYASIENSGICSRCRLYRQMDYFRVADDSPGMQILIPLRVNERVACTRQLGANSDNEPTFRSLSGLILDCGRPCK
jgi:hypothetical protein